LLDLRPDASEVGGDLIAGGQPYPGMAGDVLQRLVQVLGAERLADGEGVQGQRHDLAAAGGVGVELVELVGDGLEATPEMLAALEEERDRMTQRIQFLARNRDAIASYLDVARTNGLAGRTKAREPQTAPRPTGA
jgi:hypothetical protein